MQVRCSVFAALGATIMLSAAAPAFADRDDHGRRDWHADRDHRDWHGGGYYAPPIVVAPAPAYGYYTPPPPVAFGPGVSIGINIP
jgi:hypothetical protein